MVGTKKKFRFVVKMICLCAAMGMVGLAACGIAPADRGGANGGLAVESASGMANRAAGETASANPASPFPKMDWSIEYSASPTGVSENGVSLYPEKLVTNTTRLTVSSKALRSGDKADILLYRSNDKNNPIMYTTLSTDLPEAVFTPLTSAELYYVGIDLNAEQEVDFIISD
jgi:hypothetical protein